MSFSPPASMRVIAAREPGGPDVLQPETRPVPEPAPGEVLIQVAHAGINGPDLVQRRGHYPPPKGASDLLGLEVAGTVVALGEGAGRWRVGDAVCALTNGGGYAEYVLVLEGHCLDMPHGLSTAEAASLPETFFTIWSNLFMGADLKAGETLLVHGGAGGLGSTAIQLGKAFGARVIATDSPADRCRLCTELGADRVIDYGEEDFVEVVREMGGANVIMDIVGGPYIERNIKAAAPDGRIVQLAFNAGAKLEINLMPIMLKRLIYTGSTLRSRPDGFKTRVARDLEGRVWPLFATGGLRAVVDHHFPLEDAAAAHAMMESAGHKGKIVLDVGTQ